ncbi:hypothetical protein BaRGS_00012307 [Batillaria attramentaria]|uniref:Uncharacterized protein n=1 Tax=Batillaria attramentaria TaxID=370345 RepID=A0ABD0LAH5_9CAEN
MVSQSRRTPLFIRPERSASGRYGDLRGSFLPAPHLPASLISLCGQLMRHRYSFLTGLSRPLSTRVSDEEGCTPKL